MCWNGQASAVLAAAGLGTTAYAAYRKDPAAIWTPLAYFSLMELLQAFTYSVIDQCALPSNQIATMLGYLHITFQPFFINMVSMHFIPDQVRIRITPAVYTVCFISALVMLLQLYPFAWAGHCDPSMPLCGERLCSVHGNWHIAWEVPTNGMGNPLTYSPLYGVFFVKEFARAAKLSFVGFLVRSQSPFLRPDLCIADVDARRICTSLAVTPTLRHASPLPGHTLTASSTTAR